MFAANFPVDRLMATYQRLWAAYSEITAGFSAAEKQMLFSGTAERIYQL